MLYELSLYEVMTLQDACVAAQCRAEENAESAERCANNPNNRRDRMLTSLWLPIVVSVITTLTVNALQWSWPLLVQWFANCH